MNRAARLRREGQRAIGAIVAGSAILLLLRGLNGGDAPRPTVALRVDPNTAPPEVLMALPDLGPARVAAILEARRVAPFRSPEDLDRRVRGIGPAILRGLLPYLRFDEPTHR